MTVSILFWLLLFQTGPAPERNPAGLEMLQRLLERDPAWRLLALLSDRVRRGDFSAIDEAERAVEENRCGDFAEDFLLLIARGQRERGEVARSLAALRRVQELRRTSAPVQSRETEAIALRVSLEIAGCLKELGRLDEARTAAREAASSLRFAPARAGTAWKFLLELEQAAGNEEAAREVRQELATFYPWELGEAARAAPPAEEARALREAVAGDEDARRVAALESLVFRAESALPLLRQWLRDEHAGLRLWSARLLALRRLPEALPVLIDAFEVERQGEVTRLTMQVVPAPLELLGSYLPDKNARALLKRLLQHASPVVRLRTLAVLRGRGGRGAAREAASTLVEDREPILRLEALRTFRSLGEPPPEAALEAALKSDASQLWGEELIALALRYEGERGGERAEGRILPRLGDESETIRDAALAAAVDLGTAGAREAVELLLGSTEPGRRVAAALALGRMGAPGSVRALEAALQRGSSAAVRIAAAEALAELSEDSSREAMLRALGDSEADVVRAALRWFRPRGYPENRERVRAAVEREGFESSMDGWYALYWMGEPDATERFLAGLGREEDARDVLRLLADRGMGEAVPRLLLLCERITGEPRTLVIRALEESGGREAVPLLIAALDDAGEATATRAAAARALGTLGDPKALPALRAAGKGDGLVAVEALGSLAMLQEKGAADALAEALEETWFEDRDALEPQGGFTVGRFRIAKGLPVLRALARAHDARALPWLMRRLAPSSETLRDDLLDLHAAANVPVRARVPRTAPRAALREQIKWWRAWWEKAKTGR